MKNGIAIASLILLVLTFGYLLFDSSMNVKRVTAVSEEYQRLYRECISSKTVKDTVWVTKEVSVPMPYPVVDSVFVYERCDSVYRRVYSDTIPFADLTVAYDVTVLGEMLDIGLEYKLPELTETTVIYRDRIVEKPCVVKPNIYALVSFSNKGVGAGAGLSYDKWFGSYTFSSNIQHTVTIGYKVTK